MKDRKQYPLGKWQREWYLEWTNWTFGVWWGKFSDHDHYSRGAVALGPLQVLFLRRNY